MKNPNEYKVTRFLLSSEGDGWLTTWMASWEGKPPIIGTLQEIYDRTATGNLAFELFQDVVKVLAADETISLSKPHYHKPVYMLGLAPIGRNSAGVKVRRPAPKQLTMEALA